MSYAVSVPMVSAVTSPSAVSIFEQPRKRKRVSDPADRALMWKKFQDCWASGNSFPSPSTGRSSVAHSPIVTPPVVSESSMLDLPPVTAVSSLSRPSPQHSRLSPRYADPSSVRTGLALWCYFLASSRC